MSTTETARPSLGNQPQVPKGRSMFAKLRDLDLHVDAVRYVVQSNSVTWSRLDEEQALYTVHDPSTWSWRLGESFVEALNSKDLQRLDSGVRILLSAVRMPISAKSDEPVRPSWLDEVQEKAKELLTLPENWDSHGARRVRAE